MRAAAPRIERITKQTDGATAAQTEQTCRENAAETASNLFLKLLQNAPGNPPEHMSIQLAESKSAPNTQRSRETFVSSASRNPPRSAGAKMPTGWDLLRGPTP